MLKSGLKRGVFLALVLLLMGVAPAGANEEGRVLLFVVTGQSNGGMLGHGGEAIEGAWLYAPQVSGRVLPLAPVWGRHGIELSFAATIQEACPGRTVIMVKRWRNATGIEAWSPRARMAQKVLTAVAEAQRGIGPATIAGVLWVQNERDTRTWERGEAYEGRLREVVGLWRREWGMVPVVMMGVHTDGAGTAGVARGLAAVAAEMGPAGIVPANDLPVRDGVHFDEAGLAQLGERMAGEWLRLSGGCE